MPIALLEWAAPIAGAFASKTVHHNFLQGRQRGSPITASLITCNKPEESNGCEPRGTTSDASRNGRFGRDESQGLPGREQLGQEPKDRMLAVGVEVLRRAYIISGLEILHKDFVKAEGISQDFQGFIVTRKPPCG